MINSLKDKLLLIRKNTSFLVIGKSLERFSLCIETSSDEYCQTVEPDDLIVVSAPDGGEPEAAAMLIELVRRYHTPLIVLPKGHPGSRRLRYVVSVGPVITTDCTIRRGTHPEQHLVCASGELSGITLHGEKESVRIENLPSGSELNNFDFHTRSEFFPHKSPNFRF
jgi:hypothetical protein